MEQELKNIRPCEKKGIDSSSSPSYCECFEACEKLKSFLLKNSEGTLNYNSNTSNNFNGCKDIEDYLIKNKLVRYELKEELGLEIFLEGLEKQEGLNISISEQDGNIESSSIYSQSSFFQYSTSSPSNLEQSFLLSFYHQGLFNDHDDLKVVALCTIHEITSIEEIKIYWLRYSEKRYQKAKSVIWARVKKNMPWWALRFKKIWNQLTESQIEALNLEWFGIESDLKRTQEDKANELHISIASYQERLNFAYKKIEKLYPEFKRIKRRNKAFKEENKIPNLYDLDNCGNKIEITLTKKKMKKLSPKQKLLIKKWAKDSTTERLEQYAFFREFLQFGN